ncbi:MAG: biotin transporter BioY [Armatimonadetes bacterium]|nr:biotin transporter BioY [Armatimonadota bacterium]
MKALLSLAWDEPRSLAIVALRALAVAAALTVAAKVKIHLPWTPVPLTLQTFVVLTAAGLWGMAGVGGVVLYVAGASANLPVMAGPSVLGPTGGYLLGFVAASAVVAGGREGSSLRLLAAMAAASGLIYLCGALWLWAWSGQSLAWAITAGVLPFVPGDAAKAIAAWAAVTGLRCRPQRAA